MPSATYSASGLDVSTQGITTTTRNARVVENAVSEDTQVVSHSKCGHQCRP